MRAIAWLGATGAAAMAVYFDNQRPYPTTCLPAEKDKWQHCYVGCMIARWCPIGPFSASILAILKEVRDTVSHGTFSWRDVWATLGGAWDCAACESCEACCCQRQGAASLPSIHNRRVTAACATCIFKMKDVTGCKLAVEIDNLYYLVEGTGIDDHGDAHAHDGLCNASRRAIVSGTIEADGFISTAFELLAE